MVPEAPMWCPRLFGATESVIESNKNRRKATEEVQPCNAHCLARITLHCYKKEGELKSEVPPP